MRGRGEKQKEKYRVGSGSVYVSTGGSILISGEAQYTYSKKLKLSQFYDGLL